MLLLNPILQQPYMGVLSADYIEKLCSNNELTGTLCRQSLEMPAGNI